jgi:hypothetical protein
MKSTRSILVLLLCLLFVAKANSQLTLVVYSESGEKFTVYVNGTQRNDKPKTKVETERPGGPTFKLKVVFKDASIPEITKTVFNTPASEISYVIRKTEKGTRVLDKASADATPSDDKKSATKESSSGGADKPKTETKKSEPVTTTKAVKGCSTPMDQANFIASHSLISNAPFDGPKLSQSKKLADQNCLTTDQIVELMYLMSSQSSRLSFAKYAYKHCYDPKRYDKVAKELEPSSQADLKKYIAAQ